MMAKETIFTPIILTVDGYSYAWIVDGCPKICAQCRKYLYLFHMLRSSDDHTDGGGLAMYTRHVTEAARQLTALVPCMSQYSRGRSPLTPRSRSTFALELETNLRED